MKTSKSHPNSDSQAASVSMFTFGHVCHLSGSNMTARRQTKPSPKSEQLSLRSLRSLSLRSPKPSRSLDADSRRLLLLVASGALLVALVGSSGQRAHCLDSPAKIQRQKQLQSQPAARQDSSEQQNAGPAPSSPRIERVVRTNERPRAGASSFNSDSDAPACPPSRLVSALLPADYSGSPAASPRPQQGRAYCDCVEDAPNAGWHLTCYVGSALAGGASAAASQLDAGASLPDQLHPAFVGAQLQRRQQQAAAGSSRRRLGRAASAASDDERQESAADQTHQGFDDEASDSAALSRRDGSSALALGPNQRRPPHNRANGTAVRHTSDHNKPKEPQELADNHADSSDRSPEYQAAAKLNHQTNSDHLTFQTVPILFSIKYVKNNIIEIDCDQSSPKYKPAMLQGFNVNEISSFALNNCQLPNIPLSVLFHRQPRAQHQSPQSGAAAGTGTGSGSQMGANLESTPNRSAPRSRSHINLLAARRRRRAAIDANDAENTAELRDRFGPLNEPTDTKEMDDKASSNDNLDRSDDINDPSDIAKPQATNNGRSLSVADLSAPKVRRLSINLNKMVDQRTLISLLTGLDDLEDLQLNYIQLDLSNFEPPLDPLDATRSESSSLAGSVNAARQQSAPIATTSSTQTLSATRESQQAPSAPSVIAPTTAPAVSVSTATSQFQFLGANRPAQSFSQTVPMHQNGTSKPATTSGQPETTLSHSTGLSSTTTSTASPVTQTVTVKPVKPKAQIFKSNSTTTTSQQQAPTTVTTSQTQTIPSPLNTNKPSIALGAPRGLMTISTTSSSAGNQWFQIGGNPTANGSDNRQQTKPTTASNNSNGIHPTSQPRGLISVGTSQSVSYSGANSNGAPLTITMGNTPPTVTATIPRSSQLQSSNLIQPVTTISVSSAAPQTIPNNPTFHSRGPQSGTQTQVSATRPTPGDSTPLTVMSRSTLEADSFEEAATPNILRNSPLNVPVNTPATSSFGIRTSVSVVNGGSSSQQPTASQTGFTSSGIRKPATTTLGVGGTTLQEVPTSATNPDQFIAAGIRLKSTRRNQPQTSSSSLSNTLVDSSSMDESTRALDTNNADTIDNMNYLARVRRQTKSQLEELELSFGELLPNLKSLKLESFIDLSQPNKKPPSSSARVRAKRRVMNKDRDEMLIAMESSDSVWTERPTASSVTVAQPEARSLDTSDGSTTNEPTSDLAATDQVSSSSLAKEQQADIKRMARISTIALTKIFSKLHKLRLLQLTSNDIPYWPEDVLADSRGSLSRLYLISNNLRQVSKHSFANMTQLETIDLSSNQLRQLNSDMFRDLSNLRNVRACRNLFRKLPGRLLAINRNQQSSSALVRSESRLEKVDFSKNRYLAQLTPDLFGLNSPRVSVTSLNLSDCAFTDQMAGKQAEILFASVPGLNSLSLQGNKFRQLFSIDGLFAKNNKLQRVDMSRNLISTLSERLFNGNASQITELLLHHNQLAHVPEQFLFNLKKLRKLSLAYNRLTHLSTKTFLTNSLIEYIDLSHNQLTTLNTHQSGQIPFGNGANLRYLNLAFNNLSRFESDLVEIAWSFYTNLNYLDLSHNQFSGQISMPIFYTVSDEMILNLAFNQIQNIDVEELTQHEQILDRFAAIETGADPTELRSRASPSPHHHGDAENDHQANSHHNAKIPTVTIRLGGNPISCDCFLEPLISYSRRVAVASNPSLAASMFSNQKSHADHKQENKLVVPNLPATSRYSVLALDTNDSGSSSSPQTSGRQPQVFYQFKLNDLYCAQPETRRRELLTSISIGDLLCPIRDVKLCPSKCQCHYQSAFKTAIVDCSNRRLKEIPYQLTDSKNFAQFHIESSFSSGLNSSRQINKLDKVIIRLDSNKLESIGDLAKLFTLESYDQDVERNRFARAPDHLIPERSSQDSRAASESDLEPTFSVDQTDGVAPLDQLDPHASIGQPASNSKKIISPVVAGRNNAATSRTPTRQKRKLPASDTDEEFEPTETSSTRDRMPSNGVFESPKDAIDMVESASPNGSFVDAAATPSIAVLERAEDFRDKKYSLACEIYLDHNSISSFPESFLAMLDMVHSSSVQSTQIAPQAALPTSMLDPPVHSKLEHPSHLSNELGSSDMIPHRVGRTSTPSAESPVESSTLIGDEVKLFGRHLMAHDKKLAIMETISENVRMSKLQAENSKPTNSSGTKVTISPTLVVLSLRYNNLSNVNWRLLNRLGKLIKSINTKILLGHNPFNFSDNFLAPTNETTNDTHMEPNLDTATTARKLDDTNWKQPDSLVIESAMGDHLLAASDPSSGAYLDLSSPESSSDLLVSASNQEKSVGANHVLGPVDCPIGQLRNWLTRHHKNIGDLDDMYCVHMPERLLEKVRLASTNSSVRMRSISVRSVEGSRFDHDHQWISSMSIIGNNAAAMSPNGPGTNIANATILEKNGVRWNSDHLTASAKLIDIDLYDMCPYSGIQVIDPSADSLLSAGNQQIVISIAVIFILLSLCLLMMLVYFGDTQTILAFVYIYLNPIYSCLRLNETHLDGDKLYDAFVSYSSADRDIVMELIDKLEQSPNDTDGGDFSNLAIDSGGSNKGSQSEVHHSGFNTLSRRPNGTSIQDLNTLSRHSSRLSVIGGGSLTSGSQSKLNSSEYHGGNISQTPAYRLCIHERDWLPGHLISWNIVNSVQNSRRTILILSKDFIKSVWFQVEFHTAYYQMLEDKIDRLIVIVRGELPPKNELDKNLAFLLTTKTYLVWGEKWFWERLQYALPHRSHPPKPKRVKPPHKDYLNKSKKSQLAGDGYGSTQLQQQTINLSSIGKDCTNLLLPANNQHSASSSGSSSSSGNSSTGHLLSAGSNQQTTSNDLLSTPSITSPSSTNTTRLTISGSTGALELGSGAKSPSDKSGLTGSGGVTSIMLGAGQTHAGSNSKLRSKKQEKLQSFVDKSISNHLNLSEL